jgi:hypothetical protein
LLVRRLGKFGERLDGKGGLLPREPRSVRKPPGRFNCSGDSRQLRGAAELDATADDAALFLVACAQRIYKRECRLALGQVVAEVLAELFAVRAVVEHVVDQLERGAEMPAVAGHCALDRRRRTCQDRSDLRAGFEQLRGFSVDDLEVALLRRVGVVGVQQLQDFAFGDLVGRAGHYIHHAHAAERHHHLEGARVHEVADQHARFVAPHFVGGVAAAAQGRAVDDVVVQQGCCMNEFDDCRRLRLPSVGVAAGTPDHQHDQRT